LISTSLVPPPELRLTIGYLSDVGEVRDVNEDSVLVLQLATLCESRHQPGLTFLAVADGIGGHDAGEVASRTAVHQLAMELLNGLFSLASGDEDVLAATLKDKLTVAVYNTNLRLAELRHSKQSDMGCTLTAALVMNDIALVANVGDSRTYYWRDGRLNQVTQDHSLIASLVTAGLARPEEIYTHEHKSVIYRSLGYKTELELDLFEIRLLPGDRLILCSDGLWELARDPQIAEIIVSHPDPQAACRELVRQANANGGLDNVSVIVANVGYFRASS
jgi:protein phosphatase